MKKALITAGVVALALLVPAASMAAFPGANGRIFFVSNPAGKRYSQIFSVRSDGTGRVKVSKGVIAALSPDVSPNGRRLAFRADLPNGQTNRIVVSTTSGLKRKVVATGTDPAWSPNGRDIAYLRPTGPGGLSLCVVNTVSKKSRTVLVGGEAMISTPTWNRSGSQILFARSTSTGGGPLDTEIYSVGAGGGNPTLVTDGLGSPYANYEQPDVSPDGTTLLTQFTDLGQTPGGIYTVGLASGSGSYLWGPPVSSARYTSPRYSPDGNWFAYVDFDLLEARYYVHAFPIDLDGDPKYFSLPDPGVYPDPVWAPAPS